MAKARENIIDIQKYFLLFATLALVVTVLFFIGPFATDILFAGIIVTAVYPLHKLLNQKIHIPKGISALITLILIIALIVIPFTLFFFFVAGEATDAYLILSSRLNDLTAGDIRLLPGIIQDSFIGRWIERTTADFPISTQDIFQAAGDIVGTVSTGLISSTTNIFKSVSVMIIHALIFTLTAYYFIRDGEKLLKYVNNLLPLSKKHREEVNEKLNSLSYGIIYGLFGAAIAQGFLVGIGFALVGFNNAAFWGLIAALFSPVPYIGVSVVWIPAFIVLLVNKLWLAALFFFVWHVSIVSFADNIVKPIVIGKKSQIHPLAVLLVLLGGLFAFGITGLFWGPLVLTLTLTFLHIYELEYKSVLKK